MEEHVSVHIKGIQIMQGLEPHDKMYFHLGVDIALDKCNIGQLLWSTNTQVEAVPYYDT